jgi:hypothetical protein
MVEENEKPQGITVAFTEKFQHSIVMANIEQHHDLGSVVS